MSTKIQACRVYSKILDESRIEICFERNGKQYMGPLFWEKKDWVDDRITRYLEELEVSNKDQESEDKAVVGAYLILCSQYGLKTYDDTDKTMLHWMHVNGFTDFIHPTWEM